MSDDGTVVVSCRGSDGAGRYNVEYFAYLWKCQMDALSETEASPPPVTIAVHDTIPEIAGDWGAFATASAGTLFQTLDWCAAWHETVGRARDTTPLIVTGRKADGTLAFLIPFGLRRRAGLRIVEWLSAPHLNYGFGLYDTPFLKQHGWTLKAFWPEIRAALPRADILHLDAMPPEWRGVPHPLAFLFTARGANATYILHLAGGETDNVDGRRSGGSRRAARKRDHKLKAAGTFSFGLPETTEDAHAVLDAMFAQQEARLRELGIGAPFDSAVKGFFHRLLEPPSPLAPYRIRIDDEVVATALGGIHDGTYYALVLAMTDGPLRRLSPGDSVLRHTVAACTERGLTLFDLAPGWSDYKAAFTDEEIPLHAGVRALSWRGIPVAAAVSTRIALKRRIKGAPALWAFLKKVRRLRARVLSR